MSPRRYSDQDVALILRRAVELDRRVPEEPTPEGITLEELRGIAGEVGIDPASIDRAAGEFDRALSPHRRELASRSGVVREERRLVPAWGRDELRQLLARVDRSLLGSGTLTESEQEVRWTSPGPFRSTTVTLASEAGETRVAVQEEIGGTRGPILGVATSWTAVAGMMIGAVSGFGTALMLGLVFGIAGFFVGGGIWQLALDRSIQRTRQLAAELESLAALTAPSSGLERIGGSPEP